MVRSAAEGKNRVAWIFTVIGSIGFILIVFVGFVVYVSHDQMVNGLKAAETLKYLETEFKMIAPPPNALQLRYNSMHKAHQGDVTCEYKTDLGYESIKAHYDQEMQSRGWTFVRERPITIWRHDYGGKQSIYCKGIYDATLEYSGKEPGMEGTFAFTLSWGLSDECK